MTKIAIDASRAFLHERTGIEEYSYQIIKHLRITLLEERVILFLRRGTKENIDFTLPKNWVVKELWSPRLWTYVRLSLAILIHRPEYLFVPGHIVPPIHPKKTTVVIHGLEYEMHPASYSRYERFSMRRGIKNSCRWARNIVCVSNNTKKDLIRLYDIDQEKIRVAYEGVNRAPDEKMDLSQETLAKYNLNDKEYFIFVGRLEERKNISRILNAFEILKKHFLVPHKLVLAGKGGYGWDRISKEIAEHPFTHDIVLTGFVSTEEKFSLLRHASICLFPTLYEGFGLPILEAQQLSVPVITSNNSSLKEIALDSALLVDPYVAADIAEKINLLVTNEQLRARIIQKGLENCNRFTWERSAQLVTKMIFRK